MNMVRKEAGGQHCLLNLQGVLLMNSNVGPFCISSGHILIGLRINEIIGARVLLTALISKCNVLEIGDPNNLWLTWINTIYGQHLKLIWM